MSDIAVSVEGIGKRYRLGVSQPYHTLRDSLAKLALAPSRWFARKGQSPLTNGTETIWALSDVSFQVRRGEVVGIIGSNGAGKSTLLKILSQITEPTTGEINLTGRVGSLLEVGTGFHPELTGRENIFLNGAILGMRRSEIVRKFDEIVAFAEVERFMDTPVKHYSSGMYMRLAFAVAAHLEPEILIVDEVLAVGDAEFQKKCLGKMGDVARSGRTVLFVSHNLSAVQTLCTRAIQLHCGQMVGDGLAKEQVGLYLKRLSTQVSHTLENRRDREGNGRLKFTSVQIIDHHGNPTDSVYSGDAVEFRLNYCTDLPGTCSEAAISIWSTEGIKVFHVDSKMKGTALALPKLNGYYSCRLPCNPLAPGRYYTNVLAAIEGRLADHVQWACEFEVQEGDFFKTGRPVGRDGGGVVMVEHEWL